MQTSEPAQQPAQLLQPEGVRPARGRRIQPLSLNTKAVLMLLVVIAVAAAAIYVKDSNDNGELPLTTGTTPSQTLSDPPVVTPQQKKALQYGLYVLAATEEAYRTANGQYGTDSAALDHLGYDQIPGRSRLAILAGVNASKDFCLIGSVDGKAPWAVWDSASHGLKSKTFDNRVKAARYCSDNTIKTFVPVH